LFHDLLKNLGEANYLKQGIIPNYHSKSIESEYWMICQNNVD